MAHRCTHHGTDTKESRRIYSALQCVAVCCIVLQCVAVWWHTYQGVTSHICISHGTHLFLCFLKSALYTLKRALRILKRALYILKRALRILKRALYTLKGGLYSERPRTSVNESRTAHMKPTYWNTPSCAMAHMSLCILERAVHVMKRALRILKQPYIFWKEAYTSETPRLVLWHI